MTSIYMPQITKRLTLTRAIMAACLTLSGSLLAQAASTDTMDDMADRYVAKDTHPISAQEKASLEISGRWKNSSMKPGVGPDGSVRFMFGAQQTTIVCAVFNVCDLALEPGETISSFVLGDSVRWAIEPAITGEGDNATEHLTIKPLDANLTTTMVIATDRRTYHLKLRSHRSQYMPSVSFIYEEAERTKWEALRQHQLKEKEQQRQANTIPQTGESIQDLDFNYSVSGSAPFKPVRVYSNGRNTTIELPASVSQTDAPTLLVLKKEGGVFKDEETMIVNYRLQKNRFIVDAVFDKAILITGVGSAQDRVTITHNK